MDLKILLYVLFLVFISLPVEAGRIFSTKYEEFQKTKRSVKVKTIKPRNSPAVTALMIDDILLSPNYKTKALKENLTETSIIDNNITSNITDQISVIGLDKSDLNIILKILNNYTIDIKNILNGVKSVVGEIKIDEVTTKIAHKILEMIEEAALKFQPNKFKELSVIKTKEKDIYSFIHTLVHKEVQDHQNCSKLLKTVLHKLMSNADLIQSILRDYVANKDKSNGTFHQTIKYISTKSPVFDVNNIKNISISQNKFTEQASQETDTTTIKDEVITVLKHNTTAKVNTHPSTSINEYNLLIPSEENTSEHLVIPLRTETDTSAMEIETGNVTVSNEFNDPPLLKEEAVSLPSTEKQLVSFTTEDYSLSTETMHNGTIVPNFRDLLSTESGLLTETTSNITVTPHYKELLNTSNKSPTETTSTTVKTVPVEFSTWIMENTIQDNNPQEIVTLPPTAESPVSFTTENHNLTTQHANKTIILHSTDLLSTANESPKETISTTVKIAPAGTPSTQIIENTNQNNNAQETVTLSHITESSEPFTNEDFNLTTEHTNETGIFHFTNALSITSESLTETFSTTMKTKPVVSLSTLIMENTTQHNNSQETVTLSFATESPVPFTIEYLNFTHANENNIRTMSQSTDSLSTANESPNETITTTTVKTVPAATLTALVIKNETYLHATEKQYSGSPTTPTLKNTSNVDANGVLPQMISCGVGTKWLSNCHNCHCGKNGQPQCELIDDCKLRPYGEPMLCKPYTTFELDDCNRCQCNGDGVPICTIVDCKDEFLKEGECPAFKSLSRCASGTSWQSNCHRCVCIDGKRTCDKLPDCELREYGSPSKCKPNTPFGNQCMKCNCNDEGAPFCEITCPGFNSVTSAQEDIK